MTDTKFYTALPETFPRLLFNPDDKRVLASKHEQLFEAVQQEFVTRGLFFDAAYEAPGLTNGPGLQVACVWPTGAGVLVRGHRVTQNGLWQGNTPDADGTYYLQITTAGDYTLSAVETATALTVATAVKSGAAYVLTPRITASFVRLVGLQTAGGTVPRWRGLWAAGQSYAVGDVVLTEGADRWNLSIATTSHLATVDNAPDDLGGGTPWELYLPGGLDGAPGAMSAPPTSRGAWAPGAEITAGDLVVDGDTYQALSTHLTAAENRPTGPLGNTYWRIYTRRGETGATGLGQRPVSAGAWTAGSSYQQTAALFHTVHHDGALWDCLVTHDATLETAPGTPGGATLWRMALPPAETEPATRWLTTGWLNGIGVLVGDRLYHKPTVDTGGTVRALVAHDASPATEPWVGADWLTVWGIVARDGGKGSDGTPGTNGLPGGPGAPGPGGANGSTPTLKGAWALDTPYTLPDLVRAPLPSGRGAGWQCLQPHVSSAEIAPGSDGGATYWALAWQDGLDGVGAGAVKVTAEDASGGVLADKLVEGENITLAVVTDAETGVQTLQITASSLALTGENGLINGAFGTGDSTAWTAGFSGSTTVEATGEGYSGYEAKIASGTLAQTVAVTPGEVVSLSLYATLETGGSGAVALYDDDTELAFALFTGTTRNYVTLENVTIPEGCTVLTVITGRVDSGGGQQGAAGVWVGNLMLVRQSTALPYRPASSDPVNSGVTDHGALTGLDDDDHPQYLMLEEADLLYPDIDDFGDLADEVAAARGTELTLGDRLTEIESELGDALTQTEGDARYVRTVNGVAPDGSGNVDVEGGGGGGTATLFTRPQGRLLASNLYERNHSFITVGLDDKLYAATAVNQNEGMAGPPYGIDVWSSTNNGYTWVWVQRLFPPGAGSGGYFYNLPPAISADADGNISVMTWGSSTTYGSTLLLFERKAGVWSSMIAIGETDMLASPSFDMCHDSNGHLHMAYWRYPAAGGAANIYYRRRQADGTLDTPVALSADYYGDLTDQATAVYIRMNPTTGYPVVVGPRWEYSPYDALLMAVYRTANLTTFTESVATAAALTINSVAIAQNGTVWITNTSGYCMKQTSAGTWSDESARTAASAYQVAVDDTAAGAESVFTIDGSFYGGIDPLAGGPYNILVKHDGAARVQVPYIYNAYAVDPLCLLFGGRPLAQPIAFVTTHSGHVIAHPLTGG